jgi:hypothetical protein
MLLPGAKRSKPGEKSSAMRSVFADAIRVRAQAVDLWELAPKVVGVGPSLDTIQYVLCLESPALQMPALRKQAQSQQRVSATASTLRKPSINEMTTDAHCSGCGDGSASGSPASGQGDGGCFGVDCGNGCGGGGESSCGSCYGMIGADGPRWQQR